MERSQNSVTALTLTTFWSCRQRVGYGDGPGHTTSISTTIQSSHSERNARGLFCAQLLARVLHPLAKTPIPRHLPADFVHAMDHR